MSRRWTNKQLQNSIHQSTIIDRDVQVNKKYRYFITLLVKKINIDNIRYNFFSQEQYWFY